MSPWVSAEIERDMTRQRRQRALAKWKALRRGCFATVFRQDEGSSRGARGGGLTKSRCREDVRVVGGEHTDMGPSEVDFAGAITTVAAAVALVRNGRWVVGIWGDMYYR